MRRFRFDERAGRAITAFGSAGLTLTPIQRLAGEAQLSCMRLAPSGAVGYHQAGGPQLFLVVEGAGWTRGAAEERHAIQAGEAVYWAPGEWHAAGSETGMTALVLEAESLDPAQFLPELTEKEAL